MSELFISYEDKLNAVEECLEDYTAPIFIVGVIGPIHDSQTLTTLSATVPKEELIIKNHKYPTWLCKVNDNSVRNENILLITNFQDISTAEQKFFIDLICENMISSEELPENLKVIINAQYECPIIPEIREVIQYFKI